MASGYKVCKIKTCANRTETVWRRFMNKHLYACDSLKFK